jgi:Galactose oxidase, central domain
MIVGRSGHTATRLLDGRVLVAGGDPSGTTAELYDPTTGTWSRTGSTMLKRIHNGKVEVRDPNTGHYLPGNATGGRTEGAKDRFPRNSFKAMNEIMAGWLREL